MFFTLKLVNNCELIFHEHHERLFFMPAIFRIIDRTCRYASQVANLFSTFLNSIEYFSHVDDGKYNVLLCYLRNSSKYAIHLVVINIGKKPSMGGWPWQMTKPK